MKRILLALVILLVAASFVYAQQQGASSPPTTTQTKQNAQQYLTQAQANGSEYVSTLDDLRTRNRSNLDAITFNRLKAEIDRLESLIETEEARLGASLDKGNKVGSDTITRIQQMIDQHKAKTEELQAFISS